MCRRIRRRPRRIPAEGTKEAQRLREGEKGWEGSYRVELKCLLAVVVMHTHASCRKGAQHRREQPGGAGLGKVMGHRCRGRR